MSAHTDSVGESDNVTEGAEMGPILGPDDNVGLVGDLVGAVVGDVDETGIVGDPVGVTEGLDDGLSDGLSDLIAVGVALGLDDTFIDGLSDKASTGDAEGEELVRSVSEFRILSPPPQSQHACFAVNPKLMNISP